MQVLSMPAMLPTDIAQAVLVGRVWRSGKHAGPSVVVVRKAEVFDITQSAQTVSELFERTDLLSFVQTCSGQSLGSVSSWVEKSLTDAANPTRERVLAPCDLQAIKACGVTFAVSLLERVIEEQAGGDAARAQQVRAQMQRSLGADLSAIKPGSPQAAALKATLIAQNAWSQYLEVGIGPDAEVFSKSQPMSAVGLGDDVGLLRSSQWNNPEPEIVLAVNSQGKIVGVTLGNDVNLRDIEGRSALLLGKAKDNNGSCAIGSFVRLFDGAFNLDSVRAAQLSLRVEGKTDGFLLEGSSQMQKISRDPLELVVQTFGAHHQYPDGFFLFLGTMFSPIQDRGEAGQGFTHHLGDRVTISTPLLGSLVNHVNYSDAIPPWTFGVRALFKNLAARGITTST